MSNLLRHGLFRLLFAVAATLSIDGFLGQIEMMSSPEDQALAFMAMTAFPFVLAEVLLPAARDGRKPEMRWAERLLRALLLGIAWSGIGAGAAVLVVLR